MAKVTKVRDFTHEYDYAAFSVVRVNNNLVAELGGRNAWVRIWGQYVPLIRRVRGAGDSPGLPKDAIELDYDSRHDLRATGERDSDGFHSCDLEIQRASVRQVTRSLGQSKRRIPSALSSRDGWSCAWRRWVGSGCTKFDQVTDA